MSTNIQKLDKSQIELKVEVPSEEFQGFFEKATLNLGKDLEIEGFRKGHAPKEMIEKTIGQEAILKTAAELCVKENYQKAVLEAKLEPLGQPEIEILKLALGNPFEFKAKITVLPEIELPDYKKIASQVKKGEIEVTEEEIAKLKEEKEKIEKEKTREEILNKIAEKSNIELPEILIESEKKRMLKNLKQQVGQMLQISFEDYLTKIKKTENELVESFLPEVQKRVKNSLVLKAVEKKENIEVQDHELTEEMERVSKIYPHLDQNQREEYSKEVIKNEKTLQMLEGLIKS